MPTKAVAEKKNTELSLDVNLFEQDAGTLENMGQDHLDPCFPKYLHLARR